MPPGVRETVEIMELTRTHRACNSGIQHGRPGNHAVTTAIPTGARFRRRVRQLADEFMSGMTMVSAQAGGFIAPEFRRAVVPSSPADPDGSPDQRFARFVFTCDPSSR
jgi:hypothetical protein